MVHALIHKIPGIYDVPNLLFHFKTKNITDLTLLPFIFY